VIFPRSFKLVHDHMGSFSLSKSEELAQEMIEALDRAAEFYHLPSFKEKKFNGRALFFQGSAKRIVFQPWATTCLMRPKLSWTCCMSRWSRFRWGRFLP
jgi:hypothetical protein